MRKIECHYSNAIKVVTTLLIKIVQFLDVGIFVKKKSYRKNLNCMKIVKIFMCVKNGEITYKV